MDCSYAPLAYYKLTTNKKIVQQRMERKVKSKDCTQWIESNICSCDVLHNCLSKDNDGQNGSHISCRCYSAWSGEVEQPHTLDTIAQDQKY